MAEMVMARKILLMPGNARIAVSFELRSNPASLGHSPNIRHRPNIGFAQSASNRAWHAVTLGRILICDPNLQSLLLLLRRSLARR
jgi:hypothetical protein